MFKIVLSPGAQRGLRRVSPENRRRAIASLKFLEENETVNWRHTKKLSGLENRFRLRVGQIRVLFLLKGDTIYIYRIQKRGDVY